MSMPSTPTTTPAADADDREKLISAGRQRFEEMRSARKLRDCYTSTPDGVASGKNTPAGNPPAGVSSRTMVGIARTLLEMWMPDL